MSLTDFGRFINVTPLELNKYLQNKKVMNKKLSAKTNIHLLNIIIALVSYKHPCLLINRYQDLIGKSILLYILDNIIGTILSTTDPIKCKICRINKGSYEHVLKDNYFLVNKPILCNDCLQSCVDASNQFIIELTMPIIYESYLLFRQTIIFNSLINDINYYIFYLSIQK